MNRAPLPSLLPRSFLALVGVLALVVSACGESVTPIAEARALETGATVTVEGYVSVQPGAFVSALGDEGFAVQDGTGGVYVKMDAKQTFGRGAHVRVTGTLDEQNQLRILKAAPEDVELRSGTQEVSPKAVSTGDVNESVEGQLITVAGAVTQPFQDDSPYGYKLYINDGSGEVQVFVHVSAGFDKATLQALSVGDSISVTGLAAQYEATYEVAPRQPDDLRRVAPRP
ncbi:DNA-binding protein [Corallococcus sp. CA053C]|uniref:DNA-binding protein n=1 Tax=Corallococcus sp. CA053C TaxID=2316732 RepID=UPI000EA1BC34|nr:DNA-binding protein [Corallococcus sp. CA053C]RKH13316.1 DNA-binding protein [Corallococcus sp. CA053C]